MEGTSPESRKYRLIPHRGTGKTWNIEGTEQQAVEFGKELSRICVCRVMIFVIDSKSVPHHVDTVGKIPPKIKRGQQSAGPDNQPQGGTQMGTTMQQEPRTTNGEKSEVKTDVEESKVLTAAQKAELKTARETNGKKPAAKKATPKSTATKATPKANGGVKKADLGQALTAIRTPLKDAWKAIDGGDTAGYVTHVKQAIEAAKAAVKLAEKAKAEQSK